MNMVLSEVSLLIPLKVTFILLTILLASLGQLKVPLVAIKALYLLITWEFLSLWEFLNLGSFNL